ncbi:MAG: RnfABCDGE type electron transport complex subunit B [Lentisphaerae bacterium]|jgi:electron transport complex protein RnfB|nr:RnfABCDGE type electron transport complex subunit B [Lentisphaerota bacterium]
MNALFILLGTGLLIGLAIGLVVKFIAVPSDPMLDQISELMPGANCGACGYPGCTGYAAAMVKQEAKPGECPLMSEEDIARICQLLGVSEAKRERKVAVVLCSGDDDKATRQAFYNGVNNCRDAMQVAAGAKTCTYGCLGLGACARACPFGAIEITEKHLAVVHPELCRACGKCVQTCPKKLIRLVPASAPIHVFCSSPEKGAFKRAACKGACIGCRKCTKEAKENQIRMNGFLAVVSYADPPAAEVAASCPTKALRSNIPARKPVVRQEEKSNG